VQTHPDAALQKAATVPCTDLETAGLAATDLQKEGLIELSQVPTSGDVKQLSTGVGQNPRVAGAVLSVFLSPALISCGAPERSSRCSIKASISGPIQRRTSTIAHGLVLFLFSGGAGRAPNPDKSGFPSAYGLRPSSKTDLSELSRIGRVWIGLSISSDFKGVSSKRERTREPSGSRAGETGRAHIGGEHGGQQALGVEVRAT